METETKYTGEKAKLYQVFKLFDANSDGTIDAKEIVQASNELGHSIDQTKAEQIIKSLDTNGDGFLNFEEFCAWYMYGKDGNPVFSKLVEAKGKAYKNSQKLQEKLAKLSISEKITGGVGNRNNHQLSIKVGDKPPKSSMNLRLVFGGDQIEAASPLYKGFTVADINAPSIVFKGRSKDPQAGKAKFQEIFQMVLQMAQGMLPPEISSAIIPSIKWEVIVPEAGYLAFIITSDHPFLVDVISQYVDVVEQFVPTNMGATLGMEVSVPFNSKDLLATKEKKIVDVVYSSGMSLQLSLNIDEGLSNLVRNLVFNQLEKKMETSPHSHSTKQMRNALPIFLLEDSQVAFNFQTIEEMTTKLGIPGQSLNDVQNIVAAGPNPGAMLSEIPVAEELLGAFQTHFELQYHLGIFGPQVGLTYSGTVSDEQGGSTEVLNYLLGTNI